MHGYDAGSNPDTIARHLAPSLTEILGVQIMVEPKPGAAERLAATQIARMKPDGGVLYLMTGGQAVVSATDKTLSYDVLRDFDFISIVTRFPFVFTVAPDSRFKTIEAFLDEAKREPGKLTYGTSGVGSTLHMAMELLLSQTGAQITHVPYKGGIGTPYNDLIGGRLDMHVVTFSNAQPLLKTDKLRALAVTSKERHPGFPTCRRSPRDWCPTMTWSRGLVSPRRRACRRPCATGCTRPSVRRWPGPRSRASWRSWATTRGSAHRLNSAPGSRPTWRAGGRSPMSSTSRKVKAVRGVSAS